MSIEVKSITKDEDTGARTVRVRLSSSISFETPTRTITSTEHNYQQATIDKVKSSYGLGQGPDISFKNNIVQPIKQHDILQLKRFLQKNGVFHRAKRNVASLAGSYPDKFVIYYPSFTQKLLYEENQKIGIENLKTLIDFQLLNCQLKNISIPESHPNQDIEPFIKDLTSLSRRCEAYGAEEIIPYLDLGMDNELFKSKYNVLIDSGFPIIGVAYRNYKYHYPNFRFLQSRNDDVLILCSGVDRYLRSNWTTSFMHIPNFWGIDIVSLDSKAAPNQKIKPIDDIKFFNKDLLALIKLANHKELYKENLNCNCPVCSNKNVEEFISFYSTDDNGNCSSQILDKFCKLHEIYASYEEFDNERNFIKQNDSKSYIEEHQYLNKFFEIENQ